VYKPVPSFVKCISKHFILFNDTQMCIFLNFLWVFSDHSISNGFAVILIIVFHIHAYFSHRAILYSFWRFSNIPLHVNISFSFSTHLLMDIGCFHILTIQNLTKVNMGVETPVWNPDFNFFGLIPEAELVCPSISQVIFS
jgi:hypothetical protein